jgi:Amt family ammonium transporter
MSHGSPERRGAGLSPGRKVGIGLAVATSVILATPGAAGAQDIDPAEAVSSLGQQTNLLWIVIGAVLVIFMQAGFALVETGFCRAKHAAHVVSTNFAIFGLGFVGFFLVGYAFMFGGYSYVLPGYDFGYTAPLGDALIGSGNWVFLWQGGFALSGDAVATSGGAAVIGFFLYMVAFMDTVATIPTGAMAERWKWKSFVVWGLFCGAIYYPIFGAWTWGGGWLAKTWDTLGLGAGYVDFAGSGVVHTVGGVAALAGAIVLGPRIGKYNEDGTVNTLPGHHIPMAMLGCFILLFGWFGFNAASTLAATDVQFAVVATNTAIAGAFGAVVAMFAMMRKTGKPDPGMMVNGMLAGLVAITAPCAFTSPAWSAVIGSIAGVLVIYAAQFIDQKLKVDDPVGAIAVHGVCGTFGVLAVGIFANGSYGGAWNGSDVTAVEGVVAGEWGQLGAQALGAVVLWTVILGIAYAFFRIQNALTAGGIRSDEADEIGGLDLPEMGALAYPEFVEVDVIAVGTGGISPTNEEPEKVPADA